MACGLAGASAKPTFLIRAPEGGFLRGRPPRGGLPNATPYGRGRLLARVLSLPSVRAGGPFQFLADPRGTRTGLGALGFRKLFNFERRTAHVVSVKDMGEQLKTNA
jgi:hypothetical protein